MISLYDWVKNAFYKNKPEKARRVISGYAVLAQQKDVLADIALRGCIYAYANPKDISPFEAGVLEGRRQLALDIIKATEVDFQALYRLIETPNR